MKLLSLATLGCKTENLFFEYIKEMSADIDIFCFQEIFKDGEGKTIRGELKNGFETLVKILPNHIGYFTEYCASGYGYGLTASDVDYKYGIACFVRNNLKQSFVDKATLYDPAAKWTDYSGRLAAGALMAIKVEDYLVLNIHGLWQDSTKTDTEEKIEQSKKILDLTARTDGKKIICGDFNLLPDTTSIKMISDKFTNLIEAYSIKETRSALYTGEARYADYVFVDKSVVVHDFTVPNLEVSNHFPMVLGFE